jgi:glycosyltransferase involved in cell wall biosynthesis
MDLLAVLCVRNEARYISNTLTHLIENGVRYAIIDHGSTDETVELLRDPRLRSHLEALATLPWEGAFDLHRQIEAKQDLIDRLSPAWALHQDADEIIHSYVPGERLTDAVTRMSQAGYNTIDLNEFVFLPIDGPYQADIGPWQNMLDYYFVEPQKPRLLRFVKLGTGLTFRGTGGHRPIGAELNYPEERLALRHYMFVDQTHAYRKYSERRFSAADIARGWHANRMRIDREAFGFPPRAALKRLDHAASRNLDRSDPKTSYHWRWQTPP